MCSRHAGAHPGQTVAASPSCPAESGNYLISTLRNGTLAITDKPLWLMQGLYNRSLWHWCISARCRQTHPQVPRAISESEGMKRGGSGRGKTRRGEEAGGMCSYVRSNPYTLPNTPIFYANNSSSSGSGRGSEGQQTGMANMQKILPGEAAWLLQNSAAEAHTGSLSCYGLCSQGVHHYYRLQQVALLPWPLREQCQSVHVRACIPELCMLLKGRPFVGQ